MALLCYEKSTALPSEALVEQFYSLAKFIYDNRRHKLSQENVNCITMKHLLFCLEESEKQAPRTCGNFIFAKTRPNLSPFFPTRFLLSLSIHLLIGFSFFLRDLFQSLFKFFYKFVRCFLQFFSRIFQILSKGWSLKNFPNFPFSHNSFWNQKSSWF